MKRFTLTTLIKDTSEEFVPIGISFSRNFVLRPLSDSIEDGTMHAIDNCIFFLRSDQGEVIEFELTDTLP